MPLLPAASLYFSVHFSTFPLQLVTSQTPAAQICGTKLSPTDAVSRKGADQGLTKKNQHQPDPESPPLLSGILRSGQHYCSLLWRLLYPFLF